MKAVIKYIAVDGREFVDQTACEKYESILAKAEDVMAQLRTIDHDLLSGGEAFLQQDPKIVEACKIGLLDLYEGDEEVVTAARTKPASHSIIGRYICDSDSPLQETWFRLLRIDAKGREWEQPYFVSHPNEDAKAL